MICMDEEYYYGYRVVAFLDVLGFSSRLSDFEGEAVDNQFVKYESKSANEFIGMFKAAIKLLDTDKYHCYLFSDNICITTSGDNVVDLREMLFVINLLYYHFAKNGYFLRGGVDYGLFIDEDSIAIGVPLREAYELERRVAIYPRIILSKSFVDKFKLYSEKGEEEYVSPFDEYIVLSSCEINYLNIFLYVFRSDVREFKEIFFADYKNAILNGLSLNERKESIYTKYRWLAEQFNIFIDKFIGEIAFIDSEFDPEVDGFLDFVENQKIQIS